MRNGIRLVAGLFALLWAVLGFGVIDLEVTIAPDAEWLPVAILDGGWGLFVTVLIAGGFALVAVRPQWSVEISLQLLGLAALIAASAALGAEPVPWWMLLALVVPAGLMMGLAAIANGRGSGAAGLAQSGRPGVRWSLVALAVVGAVPWLAYAADMYAANRENRPPAEITNDVNHWAIQGAFAVALVLFTVLAATRPALRRFNAVRVAVCAAYLGVCSLRFPEVAAALPTLWAVLAMAWGAAVAVCAWPRLRPAPRDPAGVARV